MFKTSIIASFKINIFVSSSINLVVPQLILALTNTDVNFLQVR